MKSLLILIVVISSHFLSAQELSGEEQKLYNGLMEYRKVHNLPPIPLSPSLTTVAQTHVKDLAENNPDLSSSCNMHSWSDQGAWTPCCYTSDHKEAKCMWYKPSELTSYEGVGYEIAHGSPGNHDYIVTAASALSGWKGSRGHNAVMINLGIWEDRTWNAVGVGIYKNYAVVWFGEEADKE